MSTGTIFDLISSEEDEGSNIPSSVKSPPSGKRGFFELALQEPDESEEIGYKPSTSKNKFIRSLQNAAKIALLPEKTAFKELKEPAKELAKSALIGVQNLGRTLGPTFEVPDIKNINQKKPTFEEFLEEKIPTENEPGFVTKALKRGLENAPTLIASGPGSVASTAIRTGLGALGGQVVEALGGGKTAQGIAEFIAFLGPNAGKRLLEEGKHKDIIQQARKFGLSDQEIAPLLQSVTKQKILGSIALKTPKTQKQLSATQQALGRSFQNLEQSPLAQKPLSDENSINLIDNIDKAFFKLPSGVRNLVKEDYQDLVNHPITGSSIINFWQDINNAGKGKKLILGKLKAPLENALQEISPELKNDFVATNDLYSKYKNISQTLKPSTATKLFSLGKKGEAIYGFLTGQYDLVKKVVGIHGIQKIATNLLLNPKYQQLGLKTVQALNENKYKLANQLFKKYKSELRKDAPEISDDLEGIDLDELEKHLSHQ